MLRIVTDGTVDMPGDWRERYDIQILYQSVYFGEGKNIEEFDADQQDFYQLVKEKKQIPKTAFPASDRVIAFYRSIAQKGDTILSIHLSRALSGTFSAFQAASRELSGEFNIIAMDSGAGSAALGFMCREARLMERAGQSLQSILERLDYIRQKMIIIFTLDTLQFAYLSGRVNALQSAVASMLQIKPIVTLRDGRLDMSEKVRTRQHALERVLELVQQRLENKKANAAVVHAADPAAAKHMMNSMCALINCQKTFIADLTIPIAAHLGPGTVGIVAYPVE